MDSGQRVIEENGESIRVEGIERETLVTDTIPKGVRDNIVASLPASWSKAEVNHFINTYFGKLPEETVQGRAATAEIDMRDVVDPPSTEVALDELEVSKQSKKGLTLDSYIIVDGRSVTLRAIHDAGQLEPIRTVILEGSKIHPKRRVLYTARLIDRNRVLTITEETYRVLDSTNPNIHPHDELLSADAVKNLQAKVTKVTADTMERVLPS